MVENSKTTDSRHPTIKIDARDNVAIVVGAAGLKSGDFTAENITAVENIPQGHKIALADLVEGEPVIRYGEIIGYAAQPVSQGSWVNEKLMRMPEPRPLEDMALGGRIPPGTEPLHGYTFEGYRNQDGSAGTRNILGITTSVQCVAAVASDIVRRIKRDLLPQYPNVDDVVALNHIYGCGVAIEAQASVIPVRTLQNLACNPNLGGEVLVLGLGCEKLLPERLLQSGQDPEQTLLCIQDERLKGYESMVRAVIELADRKLSHLNKRQRTTCPASDLVVGMQCGGSDAFSGITANPAVGIAADLIVRAGGTAVFSEVTEVRDGVHLLAERAVNERVARALLDEMAWYDRYLQTGEVDRSANTTPGNKQGGLANIVEKALGSIVKSGSSPLMDVIGPGERLKSKGLVFAATPASDFVCGTLQLAAGINLQVFTTGRGTPYNLSMAPVIKVATRTALAERWHDLIDLDAGGIADGIATIEEVGWELFQLILDIASGRKTTAADKLGLYNDLALFNPGPVT